MNSDITVLYITYIDMENEPSSASSVRPQRMYQAFKDLNYHVKVLSGIGNDYSIRKKATSQIVKWLKTNTPDICYIEPPSGPLFYLCDRNLIRRIKKMNVPTGIFYRDAYWKFPEFESSAKSGGLKDRLKKWLIKKMQQRDLKLIKKCCSIVYFPTELMSKHFDFNRMEPLPPGCCKKDIERKPSSDVCTAIFTGGATIRYGIKLLLDSAIKINFDNTKLKLKIVCQENAWKTFTQENSQYCSENYSWLEVLHLNAGDRLDGLYRECDFAVVPLLKNAYHDFAMPVKLFEYLTNLLPVLVTDCDETAMFVRKNNIGMVSQDNVDDFTEGLLKMIDAVKNSDTLKHSCTVARDKNLWTSRAEKVVEDLKSCQSNVNL